MNLPLINIEEFEKVSSIQIIAIGNETELMMMYLSIRLFLYRSLAIKYTKIS